ncbi:Pimeloyl-ACP methyl ester carboxylesterase [Blastococcus sp. DSM 46786]|uniref:alpha/beta fold hydrolase n=1 Tax=Blastococcus sp. DSM 46786 TaxID=1798227 RepID=UPI0008B4C1C5|nr:alpha/beta hydrolase [Blastococcus sp. DSM 46786]SEL49207.1 Pimeloyl-ACP methyl ester carboxylesterase [Blastococcus sp. DSM 46786]
MTGTLIRTVRKRTAAVPTTDGARLHATVEGAEDAPVTVVLAHGWTLSQAAWDDVAGLLADRVADGALRLVRYDQRGHGRSTWSSPTHPESGLSIDRLGADLAGVLDQLVPTGPVVLGGHSMGGMTIMCLSATRPELFGDRVRGVALVSTSAGDLASDPRSAGGRMARIRPGVLTAALTGAGLLERLRGLVPPTHPRHRTVVRDLLYGADATDEMVLEGARIMHASSLRAFIEFLPALGDHDKRTQLDALTRVPVEIFVGDSDKLTPERHSAHLAEALPAARLHRVERTGHMLPQERPELVVDGVLRLVAGATGRDVA